MRFQIADLKKAAAPFNLKSEIFNLKSQPGHFLARTWVAAAFGDSAGRAWASGRCLDASKGGVYAVWAEEPNRAFEERLTRVGFRVEFVRARGGGPSHAVYVAKKA